MKNATPFPLQALVHQVFAYINIYRYFLCALKHHIDALVSVRNKKKCLNLIFVPQQCLYNALIMVFIVSSSLTLKLFGCVNENFAIILHTQKTKSKKNMRKLGGCNILC